MKFIRNNSKNSKKDLSKITINDCEKEINVNENTEYVCRTIDIIAKAEGARCSLITRLRDRPYLKNKHNNDLKRLLMSINFKNGTNCDAKTVDKILVYSNYILEREWDKTKGE